MDITYGAYISTANMQRYFGTMNPNLLCTVKNAEIVAENTNGAVYWYGGDMKSHLNGNMVLADEITKELDTLILNTVINAKKPPITIDANNLNWPEITEFIQAQEKETAIKEKKQETYNQEIEEIKTELNRLNVTFSEYSNWTRIVLYGPDNAWLAEIATDTRRDVITKLKTMTESTLLSMQNARLSAIIKDLENQLEKYKNGKEQTVEAIIREAYENEREVTVTTDTELTLKVIDTEDDNYV